MNAVFILIVLIVAILMYAVVSAGAKKGSSRPGRRSHLDKQLVAERWSAIEAMSHVPGGYKQAISEADKLLDYVLKGLGMNGNTLAERLKRAESRLSNRNAVWRAHKLRNALAHEVGFEITPGHAQEALADFKRSLQDLGAL